MNFNEFTKQMETLRTSINDLSPEEAARLVIEAAENEENKMTERKAREIQAILEKTCGDGKKESMSSVFGKAEPYRWFNTFLHYHNKFTKYSESVKGVENPQLQWSLLGNQMETYQVSKLHVDRLISQFIKKEAKRINIFSSDAPLLFQEIKSLLKK